MPGRRRDRPPAGTVARGPVRGLDPRRAEALRLLAQVRYYDDSFPEALRLLEEALPQAGRDPGLRAGIELDLAFALVNNGEVPRAAPRARAAVADAEASGERGLLAQALAVSVSVDVALGRGVDRVRLERALELECWDAPTVVALRPSFVAGVTALLTGDLGSAHAALARLRQQLISRGEESDLPAVAFQAVQVECLRGETAAATALAEEAVAASLELESRVSRGMALSARAFAGACRGDVEVTKAAAAEALALFHEAGWERGIPRPLIALGFLAISRGDVEAADRALRPLAEAVTGTAAAEPMGAFFLPDEVEALLGLGETERAAPLIGWLERRGETRGRTWALGAAARCRALLLAGCGDVRGARASAEEALSRHADLGMPFELARSLLVLGRVRRRGREKASAREALERAGRIFARLGAPLWEQTVRAEIERLGIRRAPTELTETERRVAGLAGSGLTNREIARALFIAPKTVEVNLTRAYRKLGVRRRTELPAGSAVLTGRSAGTPAVAGEPQT